MADIPGLIEGASEGLGLGHEFLRHIERCRMLVQVVDISGVEGRLPVDDFNTISDELYKFSEELAALPRIVVANKADLLVDTEDEFSLLASLSDECAALEEHCKTLGYEVMYISAARGIGLKALVDRIAAMLRDLPPVVVYEPEITEEDLDADIEIKGVEGVVISREDDASFRLSGAWVEALVNRVNFFDRESMMYFERSLTKSGLIDRLREAGCEEGDMVKIDDIEFEFID